MNSYKHGKNNEFVCVNSHIKSIDIGEFVQTSKKRVSLYLSFYIVTLHKCLSIRIEKRFKRPCLSVSVGVRRCPSVCTVNSTYVARCRCLLVSVSVSVGVYRK
jgi:hypothetical protein